MRTPRILVVQDEPTVAADIHNLENLRYTVVAVTASGKDAISIASEKRPDLVLMDITLRDGITGFRVTEAIQQQLDIPVVFLTTQSERRTLLRAMRTEPYGYILKPYGTAELQVAIEMALCHYRKNCERSRANAALIADLRQQAFRDPLTGLYNRRYMKESLDQQFSRAARHHQPLALIMLDLDHFKHFNDRFGHAAGDCVLRQLGSLLIGQFRSEDIVCRYGGEEIVIILSDTSFEWAHQAAVRLCDTLRQYEIPFDGHPLGSLTVSLGVAAFPDHASTPDALLQKVDAALYQAKHAGRDRVVAAAS
jgi:diguanylate cyclase (GGDEF)-like protein